MPPVPPVVVPVVVPVVEPVVPLEVPEVPAETHAFLVMSQIGNPGGQPWLLAFDGGQ
jgi:hypothetical protein